MSTPANVLVVDDEPQICGLIQDALATQGLNCASTCNSAEAQRMMTGGGYNVVITDLAMPQASGLELLAQARGHDPLCKVILITAYASEDSLAGALRLGAYDFLEKPFDLARLIQSVRDALSGQSAPLTARAARAMQAVDRQREIHLESIRALAQAVEAKDPYTRRHSDQVAHYARHLGRAAGLAEDLVESIRTAALLHDVGKIGIPDHILVKPGRLTPKEFSHVRRHPTLGFQILQNITVFSVEAQLVRHHHENWDGNGYPDGLAGEAIPRGARIINLADSIDAMLMKRTYKDAYSVQKMLDEIQRGSGTQFEPQLAQVALDWCRNHSNLLILPA